MAQAHRRLIHLGVPLLLVLCAPGAFAHAPDPRALSAAERALLHRSTIRKTLVDGADLRPEARRILELLVRGGWPAAVGHGGETFSISELPNAVRVWRRSLGGDDSCAGRVDVIPLEDYVKGVLPHEWIASWDEESLKAGSVAIRTYATAWISRGGKYDCADLCDTTYSQVYKDERVERASAAVDATLGQILVIDDDPVFAEYSAENGDPTRSGVPDRVCAGQEVFGHGRGMCQWGSQRWALEERTYDWIALHYYPGSRFWSPSPPPPDGGLVLDGGAPARLDGGPSPDAGAGDAICQRPDCDCGCGCAVDRLSGEGAASTAALLVLLMAGAWRLGRRGRPRTGLGR